MNNEFVFISNKELTGTDYILHAVEPNEVFRVFKFESGDDCENFLKKYNLLNECVTIDGYNIIICNTGTLTSFNPLPILGHNVTPKTKQSFPELKSFYEKERINGNETRLKKFARR